jgi:23S rRNA pseudouridine2605 synthase
VQVNGHVVRDPETWVDVVRDRVSIDGAPLRPRAKEVWVLHKPVGYVTTAADEHGRDTVYALLPDDAAWLAPVGRLDRDSRDCCCSPTTATWRMRSRAPATKLPKTYEVRVQGPPG